jgi:hypothetical protein
MSSGIALCTRLATDEFMVLVHRLFLIALFSTAMIACGYDDAELKRLSEKASPGAILPPEYEAAPGVFALGTIVTNEGLVARDGLSAIYGRGTPLFLSVDTTSASVPQEIAVEWRRGERVMRRQTKHAALEHHSVLFDTGGTRHWPSGSHQAVVFIDGRKVTAKDFVLR